MKKLLSVLMVVTLLLALSATAFAAQASPDNAPPAMEKEVTGEGKTADGAAVKVAAWDPKAIPEGISFKDEKAVVEDAVKSEAFEDLVKELTKELKLDEKDLVGSSVLTLSIEAEDEDAVPAVVVIFYDAEGKPVAGMYFYEDEWYPLAVEVDEEADEDDAYVLVFGDEDDEDAALKAEVKVTIAEKDEKEDTAKK